MPGRTAKETATDIRIAELHSAVLAIAADLKSVTSAMNAAVMSFGNHVTECTGLQREAATSRAQLMQRSIEIQNTQKEVEKSLQKQQRRTEKRLQKTEKKLQLVETTRITHEAERDKKNGRIAISLASTIILFIAAQVFLQVFHTGH